MFKRTLIAGVASMALITASAGASSLTWSRDPMTSAQAASHVQRSPEIIPSNAAANNYVPTNAELTHFRKAALRSHVSDYAKVDGRPGLSNPSTNDLIQWAAIKWGIPVKLIDAIVYVESRGYQSALGDPAKVSKKDYYRYPPQARKAGRVVYESFGLSQVKWTPEGIDPGTTPLSWKSTAFALDYLGATLRYFYDGQCSWCKHGYKAHQMWLSVGGWNSPSPWAHNASQFTYINLVKHALATYPGAITDGDPNVCNNCNPQHK